MTRGSPLLRRHAAVHRRQRAREAAQARRARHLRAHQHLRARALAHLRAAALRPDAQSVGPRRASPAARAAGPPPRSARACCRWRTPPTASARSARPRRAAGWSGSSPRAAATPSRRSPARAWAACSTEHAVTLSRARQRRAARRDARRPGRAIRTSAPPPARPYLEEVGADAAAAAHRLHDGQRRTARQSSRRASRRSRETVQLCAELGHHVEEARSRDRAGRGRPDLPHAGRGEHGREPREPSDGGTARRARARWRRSPGRPRRWASSISAADYVRATQTAHRLGRQMAAFHARYDVLLTPGLRPAPGEARLDRHDDGRRERVLAARVHVLAVHGVVQPHRPARDDAAARPAPRAGCRWRSSSSRRYGDEATLFRLGAQLEARALVRPQARAGVVAPARAAPPRGGVRRLLREGGPSSLSSARGEGAG